MESFQDVYIAEIYKLNETHNLTLDYTSNIAATHTDEKVRARTLWAGGEGKRLYYILFPALLPAPR